MRELKIKVRAKEGCAHTAGGATHTANFLLIPKVSKHMHWGGLAFYLEKKICICSITLHSFNEFYNVNENKVSVSCSRGRGTWESGA